MHLVNKVELPVRVERDPADATQFRLYDDTGSAVRIGASVDQHRAVSVGYTQFSDRSEAEKLRDAVNRTMAAA